MNRLILLGNGFDLAHGLKTSYHDFLLWYLKQAFSEAYSKEFYQDELIGIKREFYSGSPITVDKIVQDYLDFHAEYGFAALIENRYIDKDGTRYHPMFKVQVKSEFFRHLLLKCGNANWVNIENEYYKQLKQMLKVSVQEIGASLPLLNATLTTLIELLSQYLSQLPEPTILKGFGDLLQENILKKDIVTINLSENILPAQTLVLNFNYTATIQGYVKPFKLEVNYVHGRLGAKDNPLIFGFGDELDENYAQMENGNIPGFLAYIKSFWYFKTSNYHDLIRFIEADDFQVFILGHSCGLSDRTMLKMIFEHENCKAIKIFYHENEAHYTALTQQISRHFTDKGIMRKKIVPFDKSSPIPQTP